MSYTDNMNDFQSTEMQSIKSRNMGGGGWVMREFGHRMNGNKVVVRCARFHPDTKVEHILEYEIDPKGFSKVVHEAKGSV